MAQQHSSAALPRKRLVLYFVVIIFSAAPLGWLLATRIQSALDDSPPELEERGAAPKPLEQGLQNIEIRSLDELLSREDVDELQRVTFSGPAVRDGALQHVGRFTRLAALEIERGPIGDAELKRLAAMPSLKRLNLRNAEVAAQSLLELHSSRPDIRVLHERLSRRASRAFAARALRVDVIEERRRAGSLDPLDQSATDAIDRGLRFLAANQLADGRWSLQSPADGEQATLQADVAATGLALLCMLGAGHDHQSGDFANNVRKGLDYLRRQQDDNGRVFAKSDETSAATVLFYSHAIAAIALCEAYGMTGDERLRSPAQKAVRFLEATQNRQLGGWRYQSQVSSDTSVTGWAAMALKSAQCADLQVSDKSLERLGKWLDMAQASPEQPHLYVYNPHAPRTAMQRHGRRPSRTMSSVGLLMRLYWGWPASDKRIQTGGQYLLENPPEFGEDGSPRRDAYYWYYATQVLLHVGDKEWSQWKRQLFPLLCESQQPDGGWDAERPTPDRWGPQAGRLYVTALHLLSLEVEYRRLPIYARAGD